MKQLLRISQNSLLTGTLPRFLKKHYDNVICTDKFIIAVGDIPVGLIAHLDTVHKESPDIFHDQERGVLWAPQGLGADDRAGVYAIIDIIQRGLRPHVIFTTDEETGGHGALALIKSYPECPFELNFLIELDRRGSIDSVYYDCANDDFEEYINRFGFKSDWGTFTDISIIAPAWEVAAVNLSVGYYQEHTRGEYLVLDELDATIDKVCNILRDPDMKAYEYIDAIYSNC